MKLVRETIGHKDWSYEESDFNKRGMSHWYVNFSKEVDKGCDHELVGKNLTKFILREVEKEDIDVELILDSGEQFDEGISEEFVVFNTEDVTIFKKCVKKAIAITKLEGK